MDTLFLTLGAPFYREAGRLFVEAQTVSGLKAWQADFDRLIAASICKPGAPPAGWVDAAEAGITGAEFDLMEALQVSAVLQVDIECFKNACCLCTQRRRALVWP